MIVTILVKVLLIMLGAILSVIPTLINFVSFGYIPVYIGELPFGIDALLVQGLGYFHYVGNLIPPLLILLNGFLFVVAWKTGLKFLNMIPIVRGYLWK